MLKEKLKSLQLLYVGPENVMNIIIEKVIINHLKTINTGGRGIVPINVLHKYIIIYILKMYVP